MTTSLPSYGGELHRDRRSAFSSVSTLLGDYLALTKPGVITLLLISTCCPMILASAGEVSLSDVLWVLLGGALVSGSAGVINCIWDRDIDAVMQRTKDRPIPGGRISPQAAFIYAIFLGLLGLVILDLQFGPLTALTALVGHLFYVFIYTMWLKRTTPQNIVIGGAAGAIPPLVGWVAVTGGFDFTAILLFLIVFLWTPPHFWALALNKNDDYTRAGVPMLPVVAGEAHTHLQMMLYALSLIPVSIWLVFSDPLLGWFSFVTLSALGIVFSVKVYQLKKLEAAPKDLREKQAWDVFGFSLIYLALFFFCLVIDATLV